ncbi:MAG TPA: hypothetical protein VN577_04235 [Terriglobales bacterium]|nr:hypothetical protein [Terriglobales bacterium]
MASLFRFLLLVLLLAPLAAAASLDRNAFTFTKYDLEVRTNPEEAAIAVRGNVTLRNDTEHPQTVAVLQVSSTFDWRMIEVGGAPVQYLQQPFASDIDHTGKLTEAIVTLPQPVPPKGTVVLDIGYSGTIPKDATRLTQIGVPAAQALSSQWDRIGADFSGVRGIGHVAWYPIATEVGRLSDNTLFDVIAGWQRRQSASVLKTRVCWITDEDRSYTVVANGTFEGIGGGSSAVEGARTGCTSYSFSQLSETVPTFAIAPFEMLSRPSISLYFLTGHDSAASDTAMAAEKVQPWLEDWFGKATTKIQVVELPDAGDAPFESGAILFTPLSSKDKKLTEIQMAQQLAMASVNSPRRWIRDGLSQFAQALVRERQDGRRSALAFLESRMAPLAAAEFQNTENTKPSGDARQALVSTTDEVYFRFKAMYVWWMLRDLIGDVALQAVLKDYKADQDKDPSYVQRLVAAHSKRDLEWFFDDWVYRDRGLPDFKIASAPSRETLNNSHVVAVTVENTGAVGAEVSVTVHSATGEKSVPMLVRARQKEITRISVPGKPTSVTVNDGSVPEADLSNNSFDVK